MHGGVNNLGNVTLGVICTLSFVLGAACSAAAGYVSMWVASQSNIRVASAARRGYMEALIICFRGGAFSAILVLALCVMGVTTLHTVLYLVFVTTPAPGAAATGVTSADVPLLLVGYGFGASTVALFMQLGGGIFTKAADVGSDMVGKVEAGIPEDDPRNAAVIADLVGDLVGDCVGSAADVFESIAAEIIAECRKEVGPDIPLILRFSQWKQQDYNARLANTPEELLEILQPISEAGVDIFHCSTRRFWEPEFAGSDLNLAGWTRKLLNKPTITVGSVSLNEEFIETFMGGEAQGVDISELLTRLDAKEFDLVAVGRALIANPDWVQLMQSGRHDELKTYDRAILAELI
jgi:hypothetical protein